jgi:hypothetical protein
MANLFWREGDAYNVEITDYYQEDTMAKKLSPYIPEKF